MTKLERLIELEKRYSGTFFDYWTPEDMAERELLKEEIKKALEFYDSRNDSSDVRYAKSHQYDNCDHKGTIMEPVARWNGSHSESGICPKCKQLIVKPFKYNKEKGKWE